MKAPQIYHFRDMDTTVLHFIVLYLVRKWHSAVICKKKKEGIVEHTHIRKLIV